MHVVVTAGPTHEHLDDVRFLANGSSGRLGYALAAAFVEDGHTCDLVSGPVSLDPPDGVVLHRVVSADEMLEAARAAFGRADAVVGVAAVCDWRPARRIRGKPAKAEHGTTLELVPNPDVIATLAASRGDRIAVGFGLEAAASDDELLARGRRKLAAKDLDLIVLNRLDAMGSTSSAAVLLHADGRVEQLPDRPKPELARAIAAAVAELVAARRGGDARTEHTDGRNA